MNNRKEKFDLKLKEISKVPNDKFGFSLEGKTYPSYFKEEIFNQFISHMQINYPQAYKEYSEGSGGELQPKRHDGVLLPPKMASIASSSRFVYLSLRENYYKKIKSIINDLPSDGIFSFEDKLGISKLSSKANLDASYKTKEHAVYIEAKCHELFDHHQIKFGLGYFKEGLLYGTEPYSLGLPDISQIGKEYDDYNIIDKSVFNIRDKSLKLDIKQFICHLLAIANPKNNKYTRNDLIYLYFKPNGLENEFDPEFDLLEKQFQLFAESKYIKSFCERNKISLYLVYVTNDSMLEDFKCSKILKY